MEGNAWCILLQQIPVEQQNKMMVVTAAGTEISLQAILQTYPGFVALKGRLSGSQDAGRVFFLPYKNIDYLGFQREVKDEEFFEMFGGLNLAVLATPEVAAAAVPQPEPLPPEPAPALPEVQSEPVAVSPSNSVSTRTPLAIKSAVLEKFRLRAGGPNPGSSSGS